MQNHSMVMDLHTQIMQLPTYIVNIHYGIKMFNEHAKTLHHQVSQYQEDMMESLLTSLFTAYNLVPDQEFKTEHHGSHS